MPFDVNGTFSRSYNWQADRDAGIKILAQRMDAEFDNYAGGMNQTFLRNGTVPMTGALNMNGYRIMGVAPGTQGQPGLVFNNDSDTGLFSAAPGKMALVADGNKIIEISSAGLAFTGQQTFADGTAAAPSIAFTTDTDTGIYRTPGNIGFSIDGVNRLIVSTDRIISPRMDWDTNFYAVLNSGNPAIGVDANDFFDFQRTSNLFRWVIGGVNKYQISNTEVTSAINIFSPGFCVDSTFLMALTTGRPWINFDSNDFLLYDRAANQFGLTIGGAVVFTANATGMAVTGNLSATGTLNANGAITQNGQQVWHSGNFTPGNYYARTNDTWLTSLDAKNRFYFEANGTTFYGNGKTGTQLGFQWQRPDSTPIMNLTNGGDLNAIGSITAGVNLMAGGVVYPKGSDSNCYFANNATNPFLNMDSGDYMLYDRAANQFQFVISPTQRLAVHSAGITVTGGVEASSMVRSTVANGAIGVGVAGPAMGLRLVPAAGSSSIEGVDNTLGASYQPVVVAGSRVTLQPSAGTATFLYANGHVGVNSADNGAVLNVQNNAGTVPLLVLSTTAATNSIFQSNGATTYLNFQNGATTVGAITTNGTTTAYGTTSDKRLKTNIADADDSGPIIDALKVHKFDWLRGDDHVQYGLIAQDVYPVYPDAIIPGTDELSVAKKSVPGSPMIADIEKGPIVPAVMEELAIEGGVLVKPWLIDHSSMVPLLIKELQSLRGRVAALGG